MNDAYQRLADTLTHLSVFSRPDLHRLPAYFQSRKLSAGDHFIHAGDIPLQIGFVVSGVFRFYYLTPDGSDHTKSFRMEGDFITAYSAFLLQEPAFFSIEALEDSHLLVTDFETYAELTESNPNWQMVRLRLTERVFLIKEQREKELLLDDATTRYLKFCEQYPGLEDRVKQYHIASFLGITPVSLSRIRRQLTYDNE